MKRLLLILALLAGPLAAQDQKKEEASKEPQVQRLFVLKYADPVRVASLIGVFAGKAVPNAEMHAVAVSATKEAMTAIEEAIKRLDVPAPAPQNVELTLWMVIGSADANGSTPVPKDLENVIAQLRNTFAYKSYRLQDVQTLRTRAGQQASSMGIAGAVDVGGVSQPITTQVEIGSATVAPDGAIRIDRLRVSSRIPMAQGAPPTANYQGLVNTQFTYNSVGISADVDVKDGQKVVVGKNGMTPNEAMFVVLSARVAQ
jgi:hypothetical protein